MIKSKAFVAALVVLSGCSAPRSSPGISPVSTKGHLFIVGGGSRPPEMMRRFVELAGGPGRARILVIPNASSEPLETGAELVKEFQGLQAEATNLVATRASSEADSVVQLVGKFTGIWFAGGDQIRVTRAIQGTALHRAMLQRYREGAVVGGTSAGAAIMSDSMLTGSQHPPGDTLGYYGDTYPDIARRDIEIVPGLGFITNAIVDQHFVRRERHNRLLSVILERPRFVGFGVDEATVLIANPDGTFDVFGRSVVVVYDARDAAITPPTPGAPGARGPPLAATGLRMHLIPQGGRFDLRTGKATLP